MFADILPILIVLGWAGSKFMVGLAFTFYYEYTFFQSLILTVIGGMLGILFFSYFNHSLGKIWRHFFPKKDTGKITINKKMRFIVKLRQSYGLAGIAFLTPIFLTVPVGAVIACNIYKNKLKVYSYMFASFVFWSVLFLGLYHIVGVNINEMFG